MDEQDREFETFLEQFQLRQHGAFLEDAPVHTSPKTSRWMLAVAATAALMILSIPVIRNLVHTTAPPATIEVAGDSLYRIGEKISNGTAIRSGGLERLLLALEDGSRVELRAQSEVLLERAEDGIRVRLNKGAILVSAAKQRTGHLYVETQDTLVSVVGTVFFVETRSLGTRVGVCEGEVAVQQNGLVRRLVQWEQASTDPSMEVNSVTEAIAWSSRGREFAAILPPVAVVKEPAAPVPPPQPAPQEQSQKKEQQETLPPAQEPQPSPSPAPAPSDPPKQQRDAGADGPGKQILSRACVQCHSIDIAVSRTNGTRESYANLVSTQIMYGAPVSPEEAPVLIDFLFNTYGARFK